MRLIDADALMSHQRKAVMFYWSGEAQENVVTVSEIDKAPTIEAEPVKHGRWERTDDLEFILGDFECSVCGHLECDIDTRYLTPSGNCLYYCPNCGAKMDGGEADG